jgi:hypothetical protein
MCILVVLGCQSCSICVCHRKTTAASDLQILSEWMTGSFSSRAQADADPDYYEITLKMVHIWRDRTDGIWLYVEQAMAGKPPYRQRIYHVTQISEGVCQSAVFSFDDPLKYAGDWEKSNPLSELTPENLTAKSGCEIILKRNGDRFVGNTLGKECASDLRGAAYASSEVEITKARLVSWDRGFDTKGKQVWGAEKGGYVFDKLKDFPL